MDGWMDGWMYGWMYGWMGGWALVQDGALVQDEAAHKGALGSKGAEPPFVLCMVQKRVPLASPCPLGSARVCACVKLYVRMCTHACVYVQVCTIFCTINTYLNVHVT